jgi:hypothetical protein
MRSHKNLGLLAVYRYLPFISYMKYKIERNGKNISEDTNNLNISDDQYIKHNK